MTCLIELGYVGFAVSDLAAWERFAGDVLGLGIRPGPRPDTRLLRVDGQAHRIILVAGEQDDIAFAGWRAQSDAALDAFAAHLDGLNIAWEKADADALALRGADRMIHFADPDGNRHEAFTGMIADDSLFVPDHLAGGYVTGEGGLGHVVYGCDHYEAMVAFAIDVLGMKMSDTIHQPVGGGMIDVSFLHLNERHHSLACSSRKGGKSLHHFLLEVERIEDVGLCWERHRASGLRVAQEIGQHPNDRMISYYGVTPSGFLVEFGWGGIKVDDSAWEITSYPRFSDWGHHMPAPITQ